MKPSKLIQERDNIKNAMKYTVQDLQSYIKADPEEYTEFGCDEPFIDVRLCVNDDGWIIRTGDNSFDPYHSKACGASCVGLETEVDDLVDDLIGQAVDQLSEGE